MPSRPSRSTARCRTALPHVYAIGDVTNRKNLTPVAIAEGRAVADRLFGQAVAQPDLDRVATAVFTLPPIGTIGLSEAEPGRRGARLRVYEADFRPMRHAFTGRHERCYMKLLVDDASDRVLAVHMLGADAPEIVQSLAVAHHRRRDQGALRFDGGGAPDRGRRVRADAHAEAARQLNTVPRASTHARRAVS